MTKSSEQCESLFIKNLFNPIETQVESKPKYFFHGFPVLYLVIYMNNLFSMITWIWLKIPLLSHIWKTCTQLSVLKYIALDFTLLYLYSD